MAPQTALINGFGRIGRLGLRSAFDCEAHTLTVVHINDPAVVESSAYLLKYDSVHGAYAPELACGHPPCPQHPPTTHLPAQLQAPGSMRWTWWTAPL